ncbi:MAG: YihY/virulence factor BrkB family protein [Candidatus Geothermincolia bacterium]
MRDDDGAPKENGRRAWAAHEKAQLKMRYHDLESRSLTLAMVVAAGRAFKRDKLKLPSVYFAYNTLLAIFPLLLLVSAVLGFVLAGHQELYSRIIGDILENFPGSSGSLREILNSVIDNRALVGVIGFVGLLWAGTRIPVGLEAGFNNIWKADKRPFFKQRLLALWVLAVLGLLGMVSVGASLLTSSLLSWTTKNAAGLVAVFVFLIGVMVSLATNFLIFYVVFHIIPQRRLPAKAISIGAATGAFLFWLSEYIFNFYFVSISKVQVLYGTIGAILGLLIWLAVVGYIVFFSAEIVAICAGRLKPEGP